MAMLLRIDRRRFVAGIAYHEFAAARDGDLGMPVRIGHGALRRAYDLYDGPGERSFVLAPNLYRHPACLVLFFISGMLCFLPGAVSIPVPVAGATITAARVVKENAHRSPIRAGSVPASRSRLCLLFVCVVIILKRFLVSELRSPLAISGL